MAFVPGADFDVFISYAWADNESGWVDRFEKALTERVHVLLGQRPEFFRDLRALSGDSGARRKGFLGEREKRSGVKTNTIPG